MSQKNRPAHDGLSDDELDAALAEIASGSDRVAAIMGGALVQNTLIGALVTCLKDESEAPRLFDTLRGPLNTFYGQIVMGKALGLFGEETADALNTIRTIRNEFAHRAASLAFKDKDIAKKCATLERYEEKKTETANSIERKFYEHACYELTCELMAAGTEKIREGAKAAERQLREIMAEQRPRNIFLGDLMKLIPASAESGD